MARYGEFRACLIVLRYAFPRCTATQVIRLSKAIEIFFGAPYRVFTVKQLPHIYKEDCQALTLW